MLCIFQRPHFLQIQQPNLETRKDIALQIRKLPRSLKVYHQDTGILERILLRMLNLQTNRDSSEHTVSHILWKFRQDWSIVALKFHEKREIQFTIFLQCIPSKYWSVRKFFFTIWTDQVDELNRISNFSWLNFFNAWCNYRNHDYLRWEFKATRNS